MSGEIERIRLEDLKPYAKNPRRHGKEQIGKIAESISRYGMVQPLVVDKNGTIVIGHGRYEALRLLGEEAAPCIRVENLSPKQVRELRVADNRLNEMSGWNDWLSSEIMDLDLNFLDFKSGSLEQDPCDEEPVEIEIKPRSKYFCLFEMPYEMREPFRMELEKFRNSRGVEFYETEE